MVDAAAPAPAPDEASRLIQLVSSERRHVDIESRGDWCAWTLVKMARSAGSLAPDFFERGTGETRLVGADGHAWGYTMLRADALASASAVIEALRARACEDVEWFFQGGRWNDAEIRQPIVKPGVNRDDEGVGPGYVVYHLAGLGDLPKDALASGKAVAHVRFLNE